MTRRSRKVVLEIRMQCPKHKSYRALRMPRAGCPHCGRMYEAVRAARRLPRYKIRWHSPEAW